MKYKDNKDVEVLDPSDNRYKDDNYFKREQEYRDISEHHNTIRYHYGCVSLLFLYRLFFQLS